MNRYFFDFHHGLPIVDSEGSYLPDDDAAAHEGGSTLAAIAAELIGKRHPAEQFSVAVRNESGKRVYSATLVFHETRS